MSGQRTLDQSQCESIVKASGERCKKRAMVGNGHFCSTHLRGAALAKARERADIARVIQGPLARFVIPIDEDDPEANFEVSLLVEHRRTIAAIRFCDEMISQLHADEFMFGVSDETVTDTVEDITASEFPGVNTRSMTATKNSAKINEWENKRFLERKHLHEQHKLWIAAKLDVKRLEIEQQTVELLDVAINSIIVGLGRDSTDPEVRDLVRRSLLQISRAV